MCRTDSPITGDIRRKIALFCNVDQDAVFSSVDVGNIYEVPLRFYEEGFDQKVAIMLRLPRATPTWKTGKSWSTTVPIPRAA